MTLPLSENANDTKFSYQTLRVNIDNFTFYDNCINSRAIIG